MLLMYGLTNPNSTGAGLPLLLRFKVFLTQKSLFPCKCLSLNKIKVMFINYSQVYFTYIKHKMFKN